MKAEWCARAGEGVGAILGRPDGRVSVLDGGGENPSALRATAGWSVPVLREVRGDGVTTADARGDGSVRLTTIPKKEQEGNDKSGPKLTILPGTGTVAAIRRHALPDQAADGKVARNE